MSHGDKPEVFPEGFKITASTTNTKVACRRECGPPVLRRPVPSRGHPHETGQENPRQFPFPAGRTQVRLDHGLVHREEGRGDPEDRRPGKSRLRPERRRGFPRHLAHCPQGRRFAARPASFVDNGLLRKKPVPGAHGGFPPQVRPQGRRRRRSDEFLRKLRGVTSPEKKAQGHRRPLHRHLRSRGRPDRRGRIPCPGDHLSRCHRKQSGQGAVLMS